MKSLIYKTFQKCKSKNDRERNNSVTDLCFILEMRTWNLSEDERINRYGELADQKIIKLKINELDESEIVKFISQEIFERKANNDSLTISLLFTLGQASDKIALKPLTNIIKQLLKDFDENETYHSLISLEKLLFFNENLSLSSKKETIDMTNLLTDISRKILLLQPISHNDLESTSLRLLARLVLLLNNDFI